MLKTSFAVFALLLPADSAPADPPNANPSQSLELARGSLPPPFSPACISSPFGPRRAVGTRAARIHNGIDFPAPAGSWVRAVLGGYVSAIRRLGSEGLEVDVRQDGAGSATMTRYAHLGTVAPALAGGKAAVRVGDLIGRIGRSGITYGTHLHFELHFDGRPIDGEPYFAVKRCGP